MTRRKSFVLLVCALALLLACNGSSSGSVTSGRPNLELLNDRWGYEEGLCYVVGTIRNNTDRQYSYVQVQINLYDDSGAQVGSTLANTNNLESGGIWKFRAFMWPDNSTEYKIMDVTGF